MTSPTAEPATSASSTLYFGPWYRRSPFFEKTLDAGCSAYDIYNHMYLPGYYADPIEEYWALLNDVTVWDVSVERIVEITGPDASAFTNMLTCRDLTKCAVGQGKYVLITAEDGGIVNDPVLLRVEADRWWLALADSDAGLWARGVATHAGMDVKVREPEVYPVQVQGPKSKDVMQTLFGDAVLDIKYYWTMTTELDGIPVVISRTGWTGEVGYEIYLRDPSRGGDLWDRIMEAGRPHNIRPIAPCEARRIEAGIFNYGSDMTIADTPFHVMGLERLVETQDADYIGKAALEEIRATRRRSQAGRHRGRRRRAAVRAVAQVRRAVRRARPSAPSPTSSGRRGSRRTSATSGSRSSWPGPATPSRSSHPTAGRGRPGPPRSRSSTRRSPCRSDEPNAAPGDPPVTTRSPLTPEEIAAVRKPYRAASLLPGRAYHDPAIHEFERSEWFRRDWIVVGREEDAAAPGTYFLAEVDDEPLIVVRARDGVLRAFYNVCRHRGTAVVEEQCGKAVRFQCPYHAWIYDLDGSLVRAKHTDDLDDFSLAEYGLKPVRLETWQGFVFVSLDPAAEPLEDWLGDLVPHLGRFDFGALRVAHTVTYEVDANWKFVAENYSECYHCPGIHPQLNKLTPYDIGGDYSPDGPWQGGWMELVDDAETMALDGGHRAGRAADARDDPDRRPADLLLPRLADARSCRSTPTTCWSIASSRPAPATPGSSASGCSSPRRSPRPASIRPTRSRSGTSPIARTGTSASSSSAGRGHGAGPPAATRTRSRASTPST